MINDKGIIAQQTLSESCYIRSAMNILSMAASATKNDSRKKCYIAIMKALLAFDKILTDEWLEFRDQK